MNGMSNSRAFLLLPFTLGIDVRRLDSLAYEELPRLVLRETVRPDLHNVRRYEPRGGKQAADALVLGVDASVIVPEASGAQGVGKLRDDVRDVGALLDRLRALSDRRAFCQHSIGGLERSLTDHDDV